jgi:hypothetical protein
MVQIEHQTKINMNVGDGMACIMMECNNDFGFHGDDYESSYAM